jgi:deoxyribonuclease V
VIISPAKRSSPPGTSQSPTTHQLHKWDLLPEEARQIQDRLAVQIKVQPLQPDEIHLVAGVDASYNQGICSAAAVSFEFPSLECTEKSVAKLPVEFPYVPGLLSFREAPAILAALEQLSRSPDVLIVDGHGLAHPRRFGLACHLGIWLNLTTIGCAKSILVGESAPLGDEVGSIAQLTSRGEVLGVALRTRKNVKPVYISIGHRVDLESAVQISLACSSGYRLPEPVRQAHILANQAAKLRQN